MRYSYRLGVASLAAWCLMASPAKAQTITDFEPPAYTGSAAGTLLTGQQSWYVPVAGSADYNVFAYTGNALGLPVNPTGGTQFAGAVSPGTAPARAQHDVSFAAFPRWTLSYDVAHHFSGTLPATQNLASFSTANSATTAIRQIINLHTWSDVNTATNWNAGYNVFDSAGTASGTLSPGAAWNNLLLDNWYRESITIDFNSNLVVSVSLTDLTTGITNTANPLGWFMTGGTTGGGLALPSATRFFAGGTTVGNIAGWDNLSIVGAVPEPSSLVLLGTCVAGALGRRFQKRRQVA